jgi:uncharacterized protein YndB with AHSA1/START domain
MPGSLLTEERDYTMKISIETVANAPLPEVWDAWNNPADIKQWNNASDDWHTTHSTVDLREGGTFVSRMEAKDGSAGFDFGGTYTRVVPNKIIEYRMGDGREVTTEFAEHGNGVKIKTVFDAETQNSVELQQQGWQAILDNFRKHVEAKR